MIDTLRILVDWKCNLKCSYCCNEREEIRAEISPAPLDSIDFSRYRFVCITGGEPLLFPDRIQAVCERALSNRQLDLIILNTNGFYLDAAMARKLQGWGVNCLNIGLHYPATFPVIIERVKRAVEFTTMRVRFQVEDIYEQQVREQYPGLHWKFWKRDACERANEDRVVLVEVA